MQEEYMAQNYQLTVKTGPTPGQVFFLDKPELSIGREAANELVVSDADVSRKHARFILQGNTYLVEDLGSTNGTFVNGERIAAPVMLVSGDVVQLGDAVEMIYETPSFDAQATLLAPQPEPVPAPMPDLVVEQPLRPTIPEVEVPAEPMVEPVVVEAPVLEPPAYEPVAPAVAEPKKGGSKTGVIIAVGCVVVFCLCVVVVAIGYALYNSGALNF
jgi:hypothetical protein